MDREPMTPCPYRESGKHHLTFVIPENDGGVINAICDTCGAVRRVSVTPEAPMDDLTAEQIERVIYGGHR